jgi:hypothetical protein
MEFKNETFGVEVVELDGNTFDGCTFNGTILVIGGTDVFSLTNCTFNGFKFAFQGASAQTVNVLGSLYKGGFGQHIEALFQNIRDGVIPTVDPKSPLPRTRRK